MKKFTLKSMTVAAVLCAAGASLNVGAVMAADDVITLKLHQFLPAPATAPKQILQIWGDKVEKASGGKLKIDHFPSMQLGGKPPQLMDQVTDGVVDIVWTVVGYTPGRFPRTEVFELPFISPSAEATSAAYWELFEKDMKNEEFKDLHVLGTWVHGPGAIHSADPVKVPADLNGQKIRGATRTINMMLTELGATPVGMPVPAVSEALSKGVINGSTIPWEVAGSLKISELVNNHTEFTGNALYTLTFVMAMNKDKYESLPDDLKKVIDDNSGAAFSANAGKIMEAADGPVRAAAVENGNNIMVLDAEQSAAWAKAAQPVYDKWAADMDSKGYDGKALIAEAKALIAKHSAK